MASYFSEWRTCELGVLEEEVVVVVVHTQRRKRVARTFPVDKVFPVVVVDMDMPLVAVVLLDSIVEHPLVLLVFEEKVVVVVAVNP